MAISVGGTDPYMSMISNQASNNLKSARADRVGGAGSGLSASSTKEEVTEAVKSFESYFVEEMLKTMKDSVKLFSDDKSSDASQYVDYYMDFAIQEVASKMVDQYGGRITEDFVAQIQRNYGIDN